MEKWPFQWYLTGFHLSKRQHGEHMAGMCTPQKGVILSANISQKQDYGLQPILHFFIPTNVPHRYLTPENKHNLYPPLPPVAWK